MARERTKPLFRFISSLSGSLFNLKYFSLRSLQSFVVSIKLFIAVFSFFNLISLPSFAANESAQTFTLDGQLLNPGLTTPLLDTAAKVRVLVLNPSSLWIESYNF